MKSLGSSVGAPAVPMSPFVPRTLQGLHPPRGLYSIYREGGPLSPSAVTQLLSPGMSLFCWAGDTQLFCGPPLLVTGDTGSGQLGGQGWQGTRSFWGLKGDVAASGCP